MRSAVILAGAAAILVAVNHAILIKERHLADGAVVLLELAPVDPRSLMQGDYMLLDYRIVSDLRLPHDGPEARDGRVVVTVDRDRVARFVRRDDGSVLAPGELVLRYRVRNGSVRFATNAYFFQEGTGARYERARFGEFRVTPGGDLLLVALRDEALALLN